MYYDIQKRNEISVFVQEQSINLSFDPMYPVGVLGCPQVSGPQVSAIFSSASIFIVGSESVLVNFWLFQ